MRVRTERALGNGAGGRARREGQRVTGAGMVAMKQGRCWGRRGGAGRVVGRCVLGAGAGVGVGVGLYCGGPQLSRAQLQPGLPPFAAACACVMTVHVPGIVWSQHRNGWEARREAAWRCGEGGRLPRGAWWATGGCSQGSEEGLGRQTVLRVWLRAWGFGSGTSNPCAELRVVRLELAWGVEGVWGRPLGRGAPQLAWCVSGRSLRVGCQGRLGSAGSSLYGCSCGVTVFFTHSSTAAVCAQTRCTYVPSKVVSLQAYITVGTG